MLGLGTYILSTFKEHGIEFAYRNVTVYLPPEVTGAESTGLHGEGAASGRQSDGKILGASAAALAVSQVDDTGKKSEK
jgi:hypothetical protein